MKLENMVSAQARLNEERDLGIWFLARFPCILGSEGLTCSQDSRSLEGHPTVGHSQRSGHGWPLTCGMKETEAG